MKVLILNGSPRVNGCSSRAVDEVTKILEDDGIDVTNHMNFGLVSRFSLWFVLHPCESSSRSQNLCASPSSFGHCKVTTIKRLQSDCMCDKMRFL